MAILAAVAVFALKPWQVPPEPAASFPQPGAVDDGSNALPTVAQEGATRDALPLSPGGRIPDRPSEFNFRPAEGTKRHLVQLYDAEGKLLWTSSEVSTATCSFPSSIALEEGRYFWRVIAMPPATMDPARGRPSPLIAFELYHP